MNISQNKTSKNPIKNIKMQQQQKLIKNTENLKKRKMERKEVKMIEF